MFVLATSEKKRISTWMIHASAKFVTLQPEKVYQNCTIDTNEFLLFNLDIEIVGAVCAFEMF